jgi:hypothetical protein
MAGETSQSPERKGAAASPRIYRHAALFCCAFIATIACSCGQTRYVPVCSEHGGVASSHVTDKDDKFATWDYVCKDGTPQRPVQVQDANGNEHLEVPSDR